jgi:hypothetical protein
MSTPVRRACYQFERQPRGPNRMAGTATRWPPLDGARQRPTTATPAANEATRDAHAAPRRILGTAPRTLLFSTPFGCVICV